MTKYHVRQASFTPTDADGRTLAGYAAVFNQRTSIRDHLGVYDEVIAPGAFTHTIRNGSPKLMFDHGTHPLVGNLPLELRAILTGIEVSYVKKARGTLHAEARCQVPSVESPTEHVVEAEILDASDEVVATVRAHWLVSPARQKSATA